MGEHTRHTNLALHPGIAIEIPRWLSTDPVSEQRAHISVLLHRAHDLTHDRAGDFFSVGRVEQEGGPAGDACNRCDKDHWPSFLFLFMLERCCNERYWV